MKFEMSKIVILGVLLQQVVAAQKCRDVILHRITIEDTAQNTNTHVGSAQHLLSF